jgi:hypothetical protein
MREEWVKQAQRWMPEPDLFHPEFGQFWDNSAVWNAIYSPREVEFAEEDDYIDQWRSEVPVIYFISRLSDNQRTHYEEFFDATHELAAAGQEFEVWVANPNEAMSEEEIRRKGSCVTHVGPVKRYDYISRLWAADVVPILYPQTHIYSLGFCEAITAHNIVITTRAPDGTPVLPGSPGMAADGVTPINIVTALREALVTSGKGINRDRMLASQADWLEDNRSVEQNIDIVRATIEEVVETCHTTSPAR